MSNRLQDKVIPEPEAAGHFSQKHQILMEREEGILYTPMETPWKKKKHEEKVLEANDDSVLTF